MEGRRRPPLQRERQPAGPQEHRPRARPAELLLPDVLRPAQCPQRRDPCSLSHIIDDAAVFFLNGVELTRFNFNPGTVVSPTTFSDVSVGDAAAVGPVSLPANLLRPGTNVLAVEAHQINITSSDIVFGAQLDIVGGNVPSLTPGTPNNAAGSLPEFPDVYLNEFAAVAGALRDRIGDAEPWVEIHNAGPVPVALAGWTLNASSAQFCLGRSRRSRPHSNPASVN